MADDPDIPWLEKYKREGENAGKCWESKEGNMNSGGELPVIISSFGFIWDKFMDNKSTLKVSEHVRIRQNLSNSVRMSQNHPRSLKYL